MCDLLVGLRVDVRRDERDAGALVRAELPEDDAESIDLGLGAILLEGGRLGSTYSAYKHTHAHAHAELLAARRECANDRCEVRYCCGFIS